MQHSIAARLTARPTASFVRPSTRARERRLGLVRTMTFRPVDTRPTVLRPGEPRGLLALRARTRPILAAPCRRTSGIVAPVVTYSWTRPGAEGIVHGSRAGSAPWRG
jgi:hypothetical protein